MFKLDFFNGCILVKKRIEVMDTRYFLIFSCPDCQSPKIRKGKMVHCEATMPPRPTTDSPVSFKNEIDHSKPRLSEARAKISLNFIERELVFSLFSWAFIPITFFFKVFQFRKELLKCSLPFQIVTTVHYCKMY